MSSSTSRSRYYMMERVAPNGYYEDVFNVYPSTDEDREGGGSVCSDDSLLSCITVTPPDSSHTKEQHEESQHGLVNKAAEAIFTDDRELIEDSWNLYKASSFRPLHRRQRAKYNTQFARKRGLNPPSKSEIRYGIFANRTPRKSTFRTDNTPKSVQRDTASERTHGGYGMFGRRRLQSTSSEDISATVGIRGTTPHAQARKQSRPEPEVLVPARAPYAEQTQLISLGRVYQIDHETNEVRVPFASAVKFVLEHLNPVTALQQSSSLRENTGQITPPDTSQEKEGAYLRTPSSHSDNDNDTEDEGPVTPNRKRSIRHTSNLTLQPASGNKTNPSHNRSKRPKTVPSDASSSSSSDDNSSDLNYEDTRTTRHRYTRRKSSRLGALNLPVYSLGPRRQPYVYSEKKKDWILARGVLDPSWR